MPNAAIQADINNSPARAVPSTLRSSPPPVVPPPADVINDRVLPREVANDVVVSPGPHPRTSHPVPEQQIPPEPVIPTSSSPGPSVANELPGWVQNDFEFLAHAFAEDNKSDEYWLLQTWARIEANLSATPVRPPTFACMPFHLFVCPAGYEEYATGKISSTSGSCRLAPAP